MAGEGLVLDDEYVANMLKEDAKKTSTSFALVSGGFLPNRATANAPKPNRRFLGTLLRETESHNQALLAKEAEESRARLRALQDEARRQESGHRGSHRDERHRDSRDESHRTKRRRVDVIDSDRNRLSPPKESNRHRPERDSSTDQEDRRGKKRRRHNDSEEEYRRISQRSREHHGRRRGDYSDDDSDNYERSKRRDKPYRSRRHRNSSRSAGHKSDEDHRRVERSDRHHKRRRHRDGNAEEPHLRAEKSHRSHRRRCTSRSGSRSPRQKEKGEGTKQRGDSSILNRPVRDARSLIAKISNATRNGNGRKRAPSPDSDPDPLADIVGPLPPPPVKVKGRGAFSTSAMDSHFASSYNPNADVQPDEDEVIDDWEQQLELLKDRAQFKLQQGARLRAAGFTEEEVKKWEKGGEKSEEDVKWAKKGEGREWDRGKVVDPDGDVDVKAEWGRLKDT